MFFRLVHDRRLSYLLQDWRQQIYLAAYRSRPRTSARFMWYRKPRSPPWGTLRVGHHMSLPSSLIYKSLTSRLVKVVMTSRNQVSLFQSFLSKILARLAKYPIFSFVSVEQMEREHHHQRLQWMTRNCSSKFPCNGRFRLIWGQCCWWK